jgi:DNA sulfur modification protein DndB
MKKKLFIPALRGIFGDWVYYSCLVPATVIAERVNYAKELHSNTKLSELIQRELRKGRGIEIASYLQTDERFFNSLVIAVYGSSPRWYEFTVESQNKLVSIEDVPETALHSVGLLCLDGTEKLFALDGQHRLAGIKTLFAKGQLMDDQMSVILVGHSNTRKGLEKTRRLFTTLNKTAIPVSKGERIALDENDVMAIVVRRLVEYNADFGGDRIAYQPTNNLPQTDLKSLTTIGNLYDVLGILFAKILRKGNLKKLQFWRPDDSELDAFYQAACEFFALLREHIPELDQYFRAKNFPAVVRKYRGDFGGSIVFRPIGLAILTEAIGILSRKYALDDCVSLVSKVPRTLAEEPFADVLWDTSSRVIISKSRVMARTLILFMLGEQKASEKLRKGYAAALGTESDKVKLPTPVV